MEGMTQFFAGHTGPDPKTWFEQFAKGGEESEGGDGLDETLGMLGGFIDHMRARLNGYVIISEAKLEELSTGSIAGAQAENRLRDLCACLEEFVAEEASAEIRALRSAIAAARPAVVENLRENAPGCSNVTGNDLRENEQAIG
jgi:hypothetical protein